MEHTIYHKLLRVSVVVCAIVLLFDSGMVIPVTKSLSDSTFSYLAQSIGVTTAILPTELNQITAQLTEKQKELELREALLKEREIKSRDFVSSVTTDYSVYILSLVLFILTVLIVFNYVLDWSRGRQRQVYG